MQPVPDAIILAGGLGTRLHGVWDAPKCLVLVAGKTVLLRLLEALAHVGTRRVVLALGYKASAVRVWKKEHHNQLPYGLSIISTVEDHPLGHNEALQNAIIQAKRWKELNVHAPLIVLNGDTLQKKPLTGLLNHYYQHKEKTVAAWTSSGVYAGAIILNKKGIDLIKKGGLFHHLDANHFTVPPFLDVGTPQSFAYSQTLETFP